MDIGRYLLGIALLAIAIAPLALGAVALRARLLPGWSGAPARLAEAVVAVAAALAVTQLLGLLGWLYAATIVAGCVLAGGLMWLATRRWPRPAGHDAREAGPPPPAPPVARWAWWVAIVACALIVAQWSVAAFDALDVGMRSTDTQSYHGPVAARFIEAHSITGVMSVYTDPAVQFLPFSSELLHASAILLFGNDLPSLFMNFGWLALALLAAWALGRPYGVGPASLLLAGVVLAAPAISNTQPASGNNDIACVALFLSAAALLVNAAAARAGPERARARSETGSAGDDPPQERRGLRDRLPAAPVFLAALAAGLGLGLKVTMLAPVGTLAVAVVVLSPRGRRLGTAAVWAACMLFGCGVWYALNWVHFGNPMPAVGLHIGPIDLPAAKLPGGFSIAHYATDFEIWRKSFFPGLERVLGPVWWAWGAVTLLALVWSVVSGRTRMVRALGIVGLVSIVAYVLTPRSADGIEGFPALFEFTLRYVTPALALGLALLALVPSLERTARAWWGLAVPAVLILVHISGDYGSFGDKRRWAVTLVFIAVAAGVSALWSRRDSLPRPAVAAAVVVPLLALAAIGWPALRTYDDGRYRGGVLGWAHGLQDRRIGIIGRVRPYPLYGADLSNRVEYIALNGPHGDLTGATTCAQLRRLVNDADVEYVVTSPPLFPASLRRFSIEASWLRGDPAVVELRRRDYGIGIFRIKGRLDPALCGRSLGRPS